MCSRSGTPTHTHTPLGWMQYGGHTWLSLPALWQVITAEVKESDFSPCESVRAWLRIWSHPSGMCPSSAPGPRYTTAHHVWLQQRGGQRGPAGCSLDTEPQHSVLSNHYPSCRHTSREHCSQFSRKRFAGKRLREPSQLRTCIKSVKNAASLLLKQTLGFWVKFGGILLSMLTNLILSRSAWACQFIWL